MLNEREFAARAMACERKLYRAARAILLSDADCADMVQDALFKAWKNLPNLRDERFFETWLTRILINACKNHMRRIPRSLPLPESLSAAESQEPVLFEALMALPEKIRLAMVLHYNDGFTVAETARILGIPQGTVKWRLHQGRAKLKQAMGEEAFR